MTTAVMSALPEETASILNSMSDRTPLYVGLPKTFRGTVAGREVVHAIVGVGPCRSARSARIILEKVGPSRVIVCGFAGGLDTTAPPGTVILATDFVLEERLKQSRSQLLRRLLPYLPRRIGPLCEPVVADRKLLATAGQVIAQAPVASGRMVSTWIPVLNPATRASLRTASRAIAVDMECAAVAQVAAQHGIPCLGIKTISDRASWAGGLQFRRNAARWAGRHQSIVLQWLQQDDDL